MAKSQQDKAARAARLRKAREHAGFDSAADAAARFGWVPSTYAAHENGQNGYANDAAKYAKAFKTSVAFLLEGERQPLISSFDPDARPEIVNERAPAVAADGLRSGLSDGEIAHLDANLGAGLALDAPQVAFEQNGHTIGAANVLGTWRLPEFVAQRTLRAPARRIHIVECTGDSMEPRIMDGDFVFIDETKINPRMPGIFALWEGDGITIKRIEVVANSDPIRLRLIPENEKYSSYEQNGDEVRIIGRYAGRFTTR